MLPLTAVLDHLEALAPTHAAADGDNVGLLLGERGARVSRLMTCLSVRGWAMNAWPLEIAVEDKARLPELCSHQVIFVFFSVSTEPGREVLAALGSDRSVKDRIL